MDVTTQNPARHGKIAALRPYRRYLLFTLALMGLLLLAFGIVTVLNIPILADPDSWLDRGGVPAAAVGLALLLFDVFIPVPSSVIMIANGALFGILLGTVLSLAGSTGAALTGYWTGRRGERVVARFIPADERDQAARLLQRWGLFAIIISRPVPILAETIAIIAGVAGIGWRRVLLAALIGGIPAALLYAIAGATISGAGKGIYVFLLVLLLSGAVWLIGRWIEPRFRSSGTH
jgi:uncharacterized membrane protein YdjX (TVP38/TMEM64 family)